MSYEYGKPPEKPHPILGCLGFLVVGALTGAGVYFGVGKWEAAQRANVASPATTAAAAPPSTPDAPIAVTAPAAEAPTATTAAPTTETQPAAAAPPPPPPSDNRNHVANTKAWMGGDSISELMKGIIEPYAASRGMDLVLNARGGRPAETSENNEDLIAAMHADAPILHASCNEIFEIFTNDPPDKAKIDKRIRDIVTLSDKIWADTSLGPVVCTPGGGQRSFVQLSSDPTLDTANVVHEEPANTELEAESTDPDLMGGGFNGKAFSIVYWNQHVLEERAKGINLFEGSDGVHPKPHAQDMAMYIIDSVISTS